MWHWRHCSCNCNGRFCIASPTGRPRVHQKKSSVCIPVSIGRLERECFQLATKSSGRPQQLQFCQQPVPCSRSGDGESLIAGSLMYNEAQWHNEVASACCVGRRQLMSGTPRCILSYVQTVTCGPASTNWTESFLQMVTRRSKFARKCSWKFSGSWLP